MLLSILYISYMVKKYSHQQLVDIMENFYNNNLKYGITGVLFHSNGNVIQYIEGKKDKIKKLYDNIQNDYRHKNIYTLYKQEIEERLFTT